MDDAILSACNSSVAAHWVIMGKSQHKQPTRLGNYQLRNLFNIQSGLNLPVDQTMDELETLA